MTYLPEGLPAPSAGADGLSSPYWEATRRGELFIQFCRGCGHWQWGPEWICHRCNSFDLDWRQVEGHGLIYSYQRIWHPVHPALNGHGPYIAVLVELPHADNIRMLGNLLGDPQQAVPIGGPVQAVYEPHDTATPPFTLVQWRLVQP
jgi:uncharacterized OB-fold protein